MPARRCAGEDKATGDGDQQAGNHGDQAVTHGEDGVGLDGRHKVDALLQDADEQAGDDVDRRDEDGGEGVSLVEASRTIHGAVELGFTGDGFAALACALLVDQAGVHVGVDGHLLAGKSVKGEARRDLCRAHCTMRDDEELDSDEGEKEHKADDVIAANDELTEGLDNRSRGVSAFAAVQQDAPAAGQVKRETKEGEQQQQGGKDAEFGGFAHLDGSEENDDGRGDGESQKHVHDCGGQRHKHDEDSADGTKRKRELAYETGGLGPGCVRDGGECTHD